MCGMTRVDDVICAIDLGVDAIGLIFYEKSPRAVNLMKAESLLKNIPPFITVTAVVVNPDPALVKDILYYLPVQLLQFHGDEPSAFCQAFKKNYIKALQVKNPEQIRQACVQFETAKALLLDTPSEITYGGTGRVFDWGVIPAALPMPIILSGGLNSENIESAIQKCRPYAVDVSSGIEATPGIKDHQKMKQFMQAVRGAL
jgi:phosphoribosylanthranilate isomerase